MEITVLLLAAALAATLSGGGTPPPAAAAADARVAGSAPERVERALDLLRSGAEGKRALVAEAASGPAARRRAALEALGTLEPGTAPGGTVEAALGAIRSPDPMLRAAAVAALVAAGPAAEEALEAVVAVREGAAAIPPERAADALFDCRRAAVEREFLAAWVPSDGSYRGQFLSLRARGTVAARVLTAIALDRRMAGGTLLGFGPYAWFRPPDGDRDRSDVRFRALDALADAGDPAAREMLRSALRAAPARELFDDFDRDPVPAALDDALRAAIAALGDPGPLWEMIRASDETRHGSWSGTVEMRRRSRAFSTLAESADSERVRRVYFSEADRLVRGSIFLRERMGIPVDGVEWYNLACVLARRDAPGDREEALDLLEKSVRTWSVTADWIARDGDLATLRGEPRFALLVGSLRERERRMEEGVEEPAGDGR